MKIWPFHSAQPRMARTTRIGDASVTGAVFPVARALDLRETSGRELVGELLLASAEVQLGGERPDRAIVDDVVRVEHDATGIVHALRWPR